MEKDQIERLRERGVTVPGKSKEGPPTPFKKKESTQKSGPSTQIEEIGRPVGSLTLRDVEVPVDDGQT